MSVEPGSTEVITLTPNTKQYRRFIIAFVAAGTATFAQMYSPQGILPLLAVDFGISASESSLAVGATTLGCAIGVIPWARLSDRRGRVWVMTVSIVIAAALGLVVPFVSEFWLFLTLRFVEGVALAGLPAVALTTISEEITPRAAGVAAGSYIAGNTFGGLLGRLIAGPAAELGGWRFGMTAVSVLAVVAAVVFLIAMPKSRGFVQLSPTSQPAIWAQLWSNLRTPGVLVLLVQAFLLMGGFVALYNYLAFRLEGEPYLFSATAVSFLFVAYLAGTFTSRFVWRFTKRFTTTTVLVASLALTLTGTLVTLASNIVLILAGLVLMTGAFFAAHSIASGVLVNRATLGRSQAASMYNLFYYSGSTAVGWLGGVGFAAFGWPGTVAIVATVTAIPLVLAVLYAHSRGGFAAVDAEAAAARA